MLTANNAHILASSVFFLGGGCFLAPMIPTQLMCVRRFFTVIVQVVSLFYFFKFA